MLDRKRHSGVPNVVVTVSAMLPSTVPDLNITENRLTKDDRNIDAAKEHQVVTPPHAHRMLMKTPQTNQTNVSSAIRSCDASRFTRISDWQSSLKFSSKDSPISFGMEENEDRWKQFLEEANPPSLPVQTGENTSFEYLIH